MKRLFSIGCSFTNYAWPTWADMLGNHFDHYENWAFAGLGNTAIAERLAELHARENLTQNDTVVIQWTSHLRHDWHTNDQRHEVAKGIGWKTSGSIFNYINQDIFDRRWIETFWDENSYMMHTCNHILLAQNFLRSIGCTWRMTSMGYIHKMNSDYPVDEHGEKTPQSNLWKDVPSLKIYQKIFENKKDWIIPIGTFAWNHSTPPYKFKSHNSPTFTDDKHPTVLQHADYVKTHVLPSLGMNQNLAEKTKNWIDNVNNLYENSHKDFDYFCESVDKTLDWRTDYRGF